MPHEKIFQLRYVGARFDGGRLPVSVLMDLPAFRDLLVSFAKDEWKKLHPHRKRVPKGFDASLSFDLVTIGDGSAIPKLLWNRGSAQANLPGFEDELEQVVEVSRQNVIRLFDTDDSLAPLSELSSEKVSALDKFGAGLHEGERIEIGYNVTGQIVYLDVDRRKRLITSVRETYQTRLTGVGKLTSNSVYGHVIIRTEGGQDISVPIDPQVILKEFDGSLDQDVQYDIMVELDQSDSVRRVVDVFGVSVVDASIEAGLLRCQDRLSELRALETGWRDGEGLQPSVNALEAADQLIKARPTLAADVRIYPEDTGGILMELVSNGWDLSLEFAPDGSVEIYGIEVDGPREFESVRFRDVGTELLAELDERIGR